MRTFPLALLTFVLLTAPAFAAVQVSIPYNHETVGPAVQFVATANTTTCLQGVASMGVYINHRLIYVQPGTSMNHWLSVSPGWSHLSIQEWDYCGGSTHVSMDVNSVAQGAVSVTSPAPGSSVSSEVNFVASATSSCATGVAAMGIYINDNRLYTTNGNTLNHQLVLEQGWNHAVVQEWDRCGGTSKKSMDINVTNPGTTFRNLQSTPGWDVWPEYPPTYDICEGNCPGIGHLQNQHVSSPSLGGNSTQFSTWGTSPYADILWSIKLLGQGSKLGLHDTGHTLLPTLHHFTYDTDFYVTNPKVSESLEFDISMFMNGIGMTWGTECAMLASGDWDIWDNVNAKWVPTGIPCQFHQGWNHLTIKAERSTDNKNWLLYDSITLNGKTYQLDWWVPPFHAPGSWWGVTINYQMDGDHDQNANTTYLDNLSFNYW